MALYNKGIYGIVQHPTAFRFSIGSTMTSPLLMDTVNVYLMYPSLHYQPATFYSDVNFSGGVVTGLTSDMVGLSNVANTAPSYFATADSVSAITPTSLGLGHVANTAPSYFASASSLASYAPLAAPALTGMVTVDNSTKIFNFSDATTLPNTGDIYSVNGLKLQGGSTTVMTLQDTLTKCNTDLNVQGKCVVRSPSVLESAMQVCNYRTVLPTQYGVHAGRDWAEFPGSSN